jgi:hypothetical protein
MTVLTAQQIQNIRDLDPSDGSGDRVAAYLLTRFYSSHVLKRRRFAAGRNAGAILRLRRSCFRRYPACAAKRNRKA